MEWTDLTPGKVLPNLKGFAVESNRNALRRLARTRLAFGIISKQTYNKRIIVADWLDDDNLDWDPRFASGQPETDTNVVGCESSPDKAVVLTRPLEQQTLHLTILGKWLFTLGDADHYPSVPHGHLLSKSRSWPKLNPYTGMVYNAKGCLEPRMHLTKRELRIIWNDHDFRTFCLRQIQWYREMNPKYDFKVRNPMKLPRRKR